MTSRGPPELPLVPAFRFHLLTHQIWSRMTSSPSSSSQQPALSLRMVPGPSAGASATADMSSTAHREHAGVHDALRHGSRNLAHETSSASKQPLQARLEHWEQTRDTLKLTLQRNMYGMGVPIKTAFERKTVEWVSASKHEKGWMNLSELTASYHRIHTSQHFTSFRAMELVDQREAAFASSRGTSWTATMRQSVLRIICQVSALFVRRRDGAFD